MEKRINIYEAKTHLSELIKQVQETGEPYTIFCDPLESTEDLWPEEYR